MVPDYTYRVVRYDSAGIRHEHTYSDLWRARLNAQTWLIRGEVVEVDRLDRTLSLENSELRRMWREHLLADPDLLKSGFRRHFQLEYARIAYHVAFASPVLLRRTKAKHRRLAVAIAVLPKPLRLALLRAIG